MICCALIVPWSSAEFLVADPDRLAICSDCAHHAFWQLLQETKVEKINKMPW